MLEVEGVLQRSAPDDTLEEEISIAAMLPREAIAIPLPARTRNSVIDSMVELAAETGWLWDPRAMADAVRSRKRCTRPRWKTAWRSLHPRRPLAKILSQPFLALGVTTTGIPFGADVPLTDIFFLICSMEDRGHLQVLARLSRILTCSGFLNALHEAADAEAARQLVIETEENLP